MLWSLNLCSKILPPQCLFSLISNTVIINREECSKKENNHRGGIFEHRFRLHSTIIYNNNFTLLFWTMKSHLFFSVLFQHCYMLYSYVSGISDPSTIREWIIPSFRLPELTAFIRLGWLPISKCVSVPSSTNSP